MWGSEWALHAIGALYLDDPSYADDLLRLIRQQGACKIDPLWLGCHWDDPRAFRMLQSIAEDFRRYPHPRERFLEHCWARDRPWYWFIEPEDLEDDQLAAAVYARFEYEGPTPDTLTTMRYLDMSEASDVHAVRIMSSLVERSLQMPVMPRLALSLWRRYRHPLQGLPARLIEDPAYEWPAMHIVEFQTDEACLPLIPAMVNVCDGSALARRALVRLSHPYPEQVARAIPLCTYLPVTDEFSHECGRFMLPYLRRHTMRIRTADLFLSDPRRGVREGVFTAILSMGIIYTGPRMQGFDGLQVHDSIYRMANGGAASTATMHKAIREEPEALDVLGLECIARERRWLRRRMVVMALFRGPTVWSPIEPVWSRVIGYV